MDILVRQPTIYDPSSPFHLQKADLLIRDGFLHSIKSSISDKADRIIDASHLCISAGWVDIFSHFCDPGFEHRENIESGAQAAASGGFTDVFILPNTYPVLHSKSTIEYVSGKTKALPVNIHPIGAVTIDAAGKDLAEMYDMANSGAVAFSDGLNPVQSAGVLLKAFQYLKAINKTIIQIPDDYSIHPHGLMNEGIISTQLGLPGKSAMAEELMIARDIELLKYTGSKIHFTGISTQRTVDLIRTAKADGLAVSCSVSPAHLFFCDKDLETYDTNLKLSPPLRTENDRKALLDGVAEGTIDCIASHHNPQHIDQKIIEFEAAQPGMINLQSAFAVVRTVLPKLSIEKLVAIFSTNARNLFDLPQVNFTEGASACFTLFDPEEKWSFNKEENKSRSSNSAFFGKQLLGRPWGIINKGALINNSEA